MIISRRQTASYSDITCDNQLQVCLIYSDTANKAALSMSIQAGHFNDPDNCPGLAHLFEHMMFASSENHAKGNELHELLSKNRGYINAWTSSELTNFHFDCASSVFFKGFESLIDIILRPMYSELGVEREISAIDAEYKMRLNDDVRRLYDVHKHTVNPNHPFHRFSVGSATSFSQHSLATIVELLTQYHQQHVFGANIKMCIVLPSSKFTSDKATLERKITKAIEQFPSSAKLVTKSLQNNANEYLLYQPQHLQKLIRVKPYKSTRNAIISFCLPNLDDMHYIKPMLVLSHIFEDCSKNSLKHFLKQNQWCDDLSAGGALSGENYQEFSINLKLTEKGEKHLNTIIALIFAFIEQCKGGLIKDWHLAEKSRQLAIQAKLADSPPPIDEAIAIASRLHKEKLGELLINDLRLVVNEERDQNPLSPIIKVLEYMQPKVLRVYHISSEISADRSSPYYNTPYKLEDLKLAALSQQPRFSLSPPNPYMPNLKADHEEPIPTKISQLVKGSSACWLSYDPKYGAHKADMYISLEQPEMVGSAKNVTIKKLWLSMLNEHLETEFGHAEFAGLYYKVYGHQTGVSIHINGFLDKQHLFALAIIDSIISYKATHAEFNKAVEKMTCSINNAMLNKPINRLFFELNCYFQANTFSYQSVLEVLQKLHIKDVYQQTEQYWIETFVETLVVGCVNERNVINFHENLTRRLSIKSLPKRNKKDVVKLSEQEVQIKVPINGQENACICYFQAPSSSTENTVLMIMLEKLLSALLFDGLRNKRKLGYMVGCGFMPINGHPGLSIYVQSPTHNALELRSAIIEELTDIIANTNLSERRVNDLIKTLQEQFSVEHSNLNQFAQKQWLNLDSKAPEIEDERIKRGLAKLNLNKINRALDALRKQKGYRLLSLMTHVQ